MNCEVSSWRDGTAAERIPTLYGAPVLPDGSTPVLPEAECLPSGGPPVLNGTAHAKTRNRSPRPRVPPQNSFACQTSAAMITVVTPQQNTRAGRIST